MKDKIAHFFFHYKYHVIIAGILIILGGSFLYTITTDQSSKVGGAGQSNTSLEILIYGDYPKKDYSKLESKIKNSFDMFTTSDRILIDYMYAPSEVKSQEDMAARQKNQVQIKESKPDIYIFDMDHFNQFAENGPFRQLDDLEVGQGDFQFYKRSGEGHEHIYGIDVTDSELFDGMEIASARKIAVIREDAVNIENAMRFLKQLILKKTD